LCKRLQSKNLNHYDGSQLQSLPLPKSRQKKSAHAEYQDPSRRKDETFRDRRRSSLWLQPTRAQMSRRAGTRSHQLHPHQGPHNHRPPLAHALPARTVAFLTEKGRRSLARHPEGRERRTTHPCRCLRKDRAACSASSSRPHYDKDTAFYLHLLRARRNTRHGSTSPSPSPSSSSTKDDDTSENLKVIWRDARAATATVRRADRLLPRVQASLPHPSATVSA